MKLSDYRETYYEFSGKLSDVSRQLSFAGIALIWLFKLDSTPVPKVPDERNNACFCNLLDTDRFKKA